MASVSITPTTASDIEQFCAEKSPYRVQAWTARIAGEIVSIGGLAYLPDGTLVGFLNGSEKLRKEGGLALHRFAVRLLMRMRMRGMARPIVAQVDCSVEGADRWLERLGFRIVTVDREQVWVWNSSR